MPSVLLRKLGSGGSLGGSGGSTQGVFGRYRGFLVLAVAAFLSFLAWRFSFRLRAAAFLLLLPPLSFLAMGTSLWIALIDDHAPILSRRYDLAS